MPTDERPRNPATWLYVITVTLFLLEAAWAAVLGFNDLERAFRITGGVLQLLGLLAVGVGLKRKHDKHSPQSILAELLQELRETLGNSIRNYTLAAEGFEMAITMGKARLRVTCGEGAPVEQRLKRLEENFTQVDNAVAELDESLNRATDAWKATLAAESTRQKHAEEAILRSVRDLAVGDIKLETAGWVWMLIGTALAIW